MTRATRAAPIAASRVGGITIAPGGSAALVLAIAVAVAVAVVVVRFGGIADRHASAVGAVAAAASSAATAATISPPGVGTRAATSPARLPNVPWLAERGDGVWLFGRGRKARPLPSGEFGLAIDDRFLATSTPGRNGRSTIHLRATATGDPVRDVEAPIWVSAGAWTSRGLVVTGYADAAMSGDGGLVLVTPAGATEVLVPAGPFSAALGRPVARGEVFVSPSRTVVASNACGVKLCDSQFVDLSRGATLRPSRAAEGFLRAVTDDAAITTDDDARWISARRLGDGHEVWRLHDSVLLDPTPGRAGSVVAVVGSSATGWGVDRIDATGTARPLTPRVRGDAAWPRVWAQLSTPDVVVVGREAFGEAIASGRGLEVDVIGTSPTTTVPFELSIGSEATR